MQTGEFEWDDTKAAANLDKHGISFEEATFAFDDPEALDYVDESELYPEIRYKLVGRVESKVLVVIYTPRAPRIRIISAREADQHERSDYESAR
jgi:uncharacterized DUF497 family protein